MHLSQHVRTILLAGLGWLSACATEAPLFPEGAVVTTTLDWRPGACPPHGLGSTNGTCEDHLPQDQLLSLDGVATVDGRPDNSGPPIPLAAFPSPTPEQQARLATVIGHIVPIASIGRLIMRDDVGRPVSTVYYDLLFAEAQRFSRSRLADFLAVHQGQIVDWQRVSDEAVGDDRRDRVVPECRHDPEIGQYLYRIALQWHFPGEDAAPSGMSSTMHPLQLCEGPFLIPSIHATGSLHE